MSFIVLGHRGMGPTGDLSNQISDRPSENTLSSFQTALEQGADGLEFDVHITKDGELIVAHNDVLKQKIGDPSLTSEYNLVGMTSLEVGKDQTIPSLVDVLELISDYNQRVYLPRTGNYLTLNIELQGENTALPTADLVSELFRESECESVIFNGFNMDRLAELKKYNSNLHIMPTFTTGQLFDEDDIEQPGWNVAPEASYSKRLLEEIDTFIVENAPLALDFIQADVRLAMVDFCEERNLGLFGCPSHKTVRPADVREVYELLTNASERLPIVGFKSNNVWQTLQELNRV